MRQQISTAQKLKAGVLGKLSRRGTKLLVVTLGDDNQDIDMPDLPPGYSTEKLEPHDLLDWITPDNDLNEAFLTTAQKRGDRCVANFFDSASGERTLVGYGFVTTSYAPVTDQVAVKISDRLRYRYKGWTHKEHRRKYLSHARGRLNQTLFPMDQGQRMISYVEAHNYASRLNHKDVHPIEIGYCLIVSILGREHVKTSSAVRAHGFELVLRAEYEHAQ